MQRILIILVFVTARSAVLAQRGLVNYSQEQGLKASALYRLEQDSSGLIWFGSDNGLFSFDGSEFTHFGRKDGLRNAEVLAPLIMQQHEIFIISFLNGFALYKNGLIHNTDDYPSLDKLTVEEGHRLFYQPALNGTGFFAFDTASVKSFFLFAHDTLREVNIPEKLYFPELKDKLHYNIVGIRDSFLFLRAGNHLYSRSFREGRLIHLGAFSSEGKNFTENDGVFCVSTKHDIAVYNITEKTMTFAGSKHYDKEIYWHSVRNGYGLWVSFIKGGVLYYDLRKQNSCTRFMPGQTLNDAMRDRDGNFWFSGRDNGLWLLPQKFADESKIPPEEISGSLSSLASKDDLLVLGYSSGQADIIRHGVRRRILYDSSDESVRKIVIAEGKIMFSKEHELYLAGFHNTVIRKIPVTRTIKNISESRGSKVIVCSGANASEFDLHTAESRIIFSGRAYSAVSCGRDSAFVGTFRDVYLSDAAKGRQTLLFKDLYVTDMRSVNHSQFAAATNGNGVILFDRFKILRKITTADGLADDRVKEIFVESANIIWASTYSGLTRILLDGDHVICRSFTHLDGLPSDHVTACAVQQDTLYAATFKGLAVLSVKDLLHRSEYTGTGVIINSFSEGKFRAFFPVGVKRDYSGSNIIISLSFPDYASLGKINYRYRIEGLSNEWQNTSSSHIIIGPLAPGQYVFTVYGYRADGVRSKDAASLIIEIVPRFWQTRWFNILLVITAIIISVLIIVVLMQRSRSKKMKQLSYDKKIAELELQAIKAQINPHFIYNCLNSIQFLLYKKAYAESENYLQVFTKMIRQTLHYSEKTFMTIREEAEYLELYLNMEKLRFRDSFSYSIRIAESVNPEWKIPSLLIQPFVENAFKHGLAGLADRSGKIEVRFEYSAPELIISVSDNGKGIGEKDLIRKEESFGIRLTQKRIDTFRQLFSSEVSIEFVRQQDEAEGTEIKISIRI